MKNRSNSDKISECRESQRSEYQKGRKSIADQAYQNYNPSAKSQNKARDSFLEEFGDKFLDGINPLYRQILAVKVKIYQYKFYKA